jgi:SWIM zinc finger
MQADMSLTLAKIEELAPDQSSLDAGRKLLQPKIWPKIACDDLGLVWGECQGSGSLPYRVVVSETDLGYKCSCPSRKFPCKHTLALMWMRAEKHPFVTEAQPDWVSDWLARRRGSAPPRSSAPEPDSAKSKAALAAAIEPDSTPADPKAEARAAAQRERNRAEREASILLGLDELDLWLIDQIERGLAGFQSVAQEQCRLLARRLVDAKANSLATRVEQLPSALFAVPDPLRGNFLIEKLGELHLIAEAYRRQAALSEELRADIRATIGWPLSREALLGAPQALRLRDRWMVLATINEIQPDKLRRLETWLVRLGKADAPRFAVMMDFVPVSQGMVNNVYAPGEAFEAELVFYPSGAPLRAIVAEQFGGMVQQDRWAAPPDDVPTALDRYETALAARPWLGDWPLAVHNSVVVRSDDVFLLSHAEGDTALPLKANDPDSLLPLVGVAGLDAFGFWNGRQFDLKFAETPLGRWVSA